MKSLICPLVLILVGNFISSYSALADGNCEQFYGNYSYSSCVIQYDGQSSQDITYVGLEVYGKPNNYLDMLYNEDEGKYFIVDYLADGFSHDGNISESGVTYTASCDANGIHTVRNGIYDSPLITNFIKNPDNTYTLTETVSSVHSFSRTCSFSKRSP